MKKFIRICFLFTVILCGVLSFSHDSVYAAEEWVEIGGSSKNAEKWYEKFIELMADSGEKKIRLVGDIDYTIPRGSKEDFVNWKVIVKGEKSLDLNNYYINFGWNPDTSYYYEGEGEDRERKLMYMITVAEDGHLTISDSAGTPDSESGYIKFNGYIRACNEYYADDDIRNIINVEKGGLFTLDGGKLLVGRQKQEYCANLHRTVTKMVVGNAVTLSGGRFVMNGGRIEGRGYDDTDGYYSAICIRDKASTSLINDGYLKGQACRVYQYSNAYKTALSDNMDTHAEIKAKHIVKGGVFETADAKNVLTTSCNNYFAWFVKLNEYEEAMPFTYTDENGDYAYDLPEGLNYKKEGRKITFYPDIQNDLKISYSDPGVMNGIIYDDMTDLTITVESPGYYDKFYEKETLFEVMDAQSGDPVWSCLKKKNDKADADASINLATEKDGDGVKKLSQVLESEKEYILSCKTLEYWKSWNRNGTGYASTVNPDASKPFIIEHNGKELKFNTYKNTINRIDISGVNAPCNNEKADADGITVDVSPANGVVDNGISMKWLWASDKTAVTTVKKGDEIILCAEIKKKDGYTIKSDADGSFLGAVTLNGETFDGTSKVVGDTLFIYSAPYTVADPKNINSVNIIGLKEPVLGEAPSFDASAIVFKDRAVGTIPCIEKVEVEWSIRRPIDTMRHRISKDHLYIDDTDKPYVFGENDNACAIVNIYLKKGYTFPYSSYFSGAYSGKVSGVVGGTATVEGYKTAGSSIYLSVMSEIYTFSTKQIEGVHIDSLNVPYAGKSRDGIIVPKSISGEGIDRYNYEIDWKHNDVLMTTGDTYVAGEEYTCDITLNASAGYKFIADEYGNYGGEVEIPGYENAAITKRVISDGDELKIHICIQAQNMKTIMSVKLTDIVTPVDGEKPLSTVSAVTTPENCYEEITFNWFHEDGTEIAEDETFKATEKYYYVAVLTPAYGNVFEKDLEGNYLRTVELAGGLESAVVDGAGRLEIQSKAADTHAHSFEKIPEIAATCTYDGSKEYYVCVCGKAYEDSELTKKIENLDEWKVMPALGHDFGKDGKAEKCSKCGSSNPDYKAPETGEEAGEAGGSEEHGASDKTENPGEQGETGGAGNSGEQGETGGAGNSGEQGETGGTGNSGEQGETGGTGNSEEQGETGSRTEYKENKTTVESKEGHKVTTDSSGEAVLMEMKKSGKKTITVPASITVDGVTYKIATVNAYAFKNCKSAKKVILPNTIKKIKAYAFAKSNITSLKITIKKGDKLSVDKKAFKKSKLKKVEVVMSKKATKKEKNAVINAFKKAGIKKANIKVKLK